MHKHFSGTTGHQRVVYGVAIGVGFFALPLPLATPTQLLLAWCAGASTFLVLAWWLAVAFNASQTRARAQAQDQPGLLLFTLLLLSAFASVGAIAFMLQHLKELSTAQRLGSQPVARIVAHATHAQEPEWFATAPVGATHKVLAKAGWQVGDVDLWEINEAFAVVPMALMKELGLPHDKVNVNGGACALGHPIGASGARIIVTLIHALQARGLRRGVATLCIGGGEATAMAIELV